MEALPRSSAVARLAAGENMAARICRFQAFARSVGDAGLSDAFDEDALLSMAIGGDRAALHELLLEYYDVVTAHVARRLSKPIEGMPMREDIVQETFAQVIRDFEHFQRHGDQSFAAWLKKIAEHRIQDAIRRAERLKRGGGRQRIRAPIRPDQSSMADLVEQLSAGGHSPSSSAARHEAIAAVQAEIDALPADYGLAVRLRLLECRSLEETAAVMNRSPRAVQGLLDRAKKKMRDAIGRLSLYE